MDHSRRASQAATPRPPPLSPSTSLVNQVESFCTSWPGPKELLSNISTHNLQNAKNFWQVVLKPIAASFDRLGDTAKRYVRDQGLPITQQLLTTSSNDDGLPFSDFIYDLIILFNRCFSFEEPPHAFQLCLVSTLASILGNEEGIGKELFMRSMRLLFQTFVFSKHADCKTGARTALFHLMSNSKTRDGLLAFIVDAGEESLRQGFTESLQLAIELLLAFSPNEVLTIKAAYPLLCKLLCVERILTGNKAKLNAMSTLLLPWILGTRGKHNHCPEIHAILMETSDQLLKPLLLKHYISSLAIPSMATPLQSMFVVYDQNHLYANIVTNRIFTLSDLPSTPTDLINLKELMFSVAGLPDYNDEELFVKYQKVQREKEEIQAIVKQFNVTGKWHDMAYDQIAVALLVTPGLDTKVIGEFLAEPANQPVLDNYASLITQIFELFPDFLISEPLSKSEGYRFCSTLRLFLHFFRIPGEAQKIDRILEAFARNFCNLLKNDVDYVHGLAYATIMLNTDRHSAQIKKKMTKEAFVRNMRLKTKGEENIKTDGSTSLSGVSTPRSIESSPSTPATSLLEDIFDNIANNQLEPPHAYTRYSECLRIRKIIGVELAEESTTSNFFCAKAFFKNCLAPLVSRTLISQANALVQSPGSLTADRWTPIDALFESFLAANIRFGAIAAEELEIILKQLSLLPALSTWVIGLANKHHSAFTLPSQWTALLTTSNKKHLISMLDIKRMDTVSILLLLQGLPPKDNPKDAIATISTATSSPASFYLMDKGYPLMDHCLDQLVLLPESSFERLVLKLVQNSDITRVLFLDRFISSPGSFANFLRRIRMGSMPLLIKEHDLTLTYIDSLTTLLVHSVSFLNNEVHDMIDAFGSIATLSPFHNVRRQALQGLSRIVRDKGYIQAVDVILDIIQSKKTNVGTSESNDILLYLTLVDELIGLVPPRQHHHLHTLVTCLHRLKHRRGELPLDKFALLHTLEIAIRHSEEQVSRVAIDVLQVFLLPSQPSSCDGLLNPQTVLMFDRLCECPKNQDIGEEFLADIPGAVRRCSIILAILQLLNWVLVQSDTDLFETFIKKILKQQIVDDHRNEDNSDSLITVTDKLISILHESYNFAHQFNADHALRQKLWSAGFMRNSDLQDIVLVKQEHCAASTLVSFLFRVPYYTLAFQISIELIDRFINEHQDLIGKGSWVLLIQTVFDHLNLLLFDPEQSNVAQMVQFGHKALIILPISEGSLQSSVLTFSRNFLDCISKKLGNK